MGLADRTAATTTSYNSRGTSAIRLAPQFVNRLCARLETARSKPDGVSGLLFGTARENGIVVEAFRSLMELDLEAIEAGELELDDAVLTLARTAETDPGLAALDIVGWYAFRPQGGLQESDIAFHNRQFAWISDLALIVRRSDPGHLVFEFYARVREGLLSPEEHRWGASRFSAGQAVSGPVEIALRTETAGTAADTARPRGAEFDDHAARSSNSIASLWEPEPRRLEPKARPPAKPAIAGGDLPGLPARIVPSKRRNVPWFSSVILFALFAGLTFAVLFLNGVNSGNSGSIWRTILPDTGLNLRVEGQGDRVLLSWNRRNSVVRSATGAVLHIDDGAQHRDVRLDAAQTANGAVLYRPNSDDVSFRLQVRTQGGKTVAESLRVLDSAARETKPADLTADNVPNDSAMPPASPPPVGVSHVWQPVPQASKVKIPEPAPPLETATLPNPVQSDQKFDLSRLTAPPPAAEPSEKPAAQPAKPATEPTTNAAQATTTAAQTTTSAAQPTTTAAQTTTTAAQSAAKLPNEAPAKQLVTNTAPPSVSPQAQRTLAGRYTPPKPIRQVLPDISILPRSVVASSPEIDVIVSVDQFGRVTQVQTEQQGGRKPSHLMVVAAENAAKNWVFEPARLDGRPVPSEHSIIFQFGGGR